MQHARVHIALTFSFHHTYSVVEKSTDDLRTHPPIRTDVHVLAGIGVWSTVCFPAYVFPTPRRRQPYRKRGSAFIFGPRIIGPTTICFIVGQ